jgi:hypothetical protein
MFTALMFSNEERSPADFILIVEKNTAGIKVIFSCTLKLKRAHFSSIMGLL